MESATRQALDAVGPAFVVVAVFPRSAAFVHAPGLFGPRGVLLHVVGWTLFVFSMRQWVGPAASRRIEAHERERATLRRELGREPTADEFYRRLVASRPSRRRGLRVWGRRAGSRSDSAAAP
jgi:hypothetical protein